MTTERNSQSEAIIHRAGVERSRDIGGITEYPLCSRNARPNKDGEGRTPTLVLCSRNARPEKGLVRRPHFDQHGRPSQEETQASLEGSIRRTAVVRRAQ